MPSDHGRGPIGNVLARQTGPATRLGARQSTRSLHGRRLAGFRASRRLNVAGTCGGLALYARTINPIVPDGSAQRRRIDAAAVWFWQRAVADKMNTFDYTRMMGRSIGSAFGLRGLPVRKLTRIDKPCAARQLSSAPWRLLKSKVRWLLAVTAGVLVAGAAFAIYQVAQSYILDQAHQRARDVMLESRALHRYVQRNMHPALYQAKTEGRLPEDFYAPEMLSSTYIARNLFEQYNEERKRSGLPEIRYKLAAIDPRNKVNEANEFERSLIEMFNVDRSRTEYEGFVEEDGRRYLYYATPFLATEERCLKCHGRAEDAPQQLREYYKWEGGWNREVGDILAIESTMSPLQAEVRATHVALGAALAIAVGVAAMFLVNARLGGLVASYTSALTHSEARYRTLVQNVGVGITLIDRDYRVVMANREQVRVSGELPTEGERPRCYRWMGHGEQPCADCPGKRAMATGQPAEVEHVLSGPGRSASILRLRAFPLPAEEGGPAGFIEVVEDITARKRAEESLRTSEEQFRAIFEMASIGMAQADPANGRWVRVNDRMCAITGYAREELLAMRIAEITHPDDRERDAALFQSVVRGDAPNYQIEKRYVRKDGSIAWVNVNMTILRDSQGRPARSFATIEDITERKHGEEERERLNAQLMRAQRLESLGRLAGGVAHDFNNMLTAILGHLELAMDRVAPNDALREDLVEIERAAERSADLTRQLLAFARRQTAAPKVIDLNEAVERMLKMLRRLIGEDIELIWSPTSAPATVRVDPSQVDQILTNLCVNARDAIAAAGRVTIETGTAVLDEQYCAQHEEALPGEFVFLAVSDDGCGMGPQTIAKLFEPFFSTKDVGKGTGLGLATVYGIVKQNNGFISVDSEPGRGATFRIYLPRQTGRADERAAGRAAAVPARGRGTILLVEDEPAILNIARTALAQQGYTVLTAGSPKEALRMVAAHADDVRVLITDVVMPGMNGRELSRNLQVRYPNLKCLFISGYTADVIAYQGVLDEGVHFLQKPFSMKDLVAKVRQVLDDVS